MTEIGSNGGNEFVVGEECHIVARASDGPRGLTTPPPEGLDSFSNLVLLCPTHHCIVDAQPEIYTVESLQDIKAAHEARIRVRDGEKKLEEEHEFSRYDRICSGLPAVNAWNFGPSLIVVCSFGSAPVAVGQGRWRGSGLKFQHIYTAKGSATLLISSEGEFDIEYWMANESLCVVQHTFEPESNTIVPFLQRTFDLNNFPATCSGKILLSPPKGSIDALPDVMEFLRRQKTGSSDGIEESLFRVRNGGLKDPDQAIEKLDSLRGLWWYDGAGAETAESVIRELELVKAWKCKAV
ncbi:MAG: hypothetical protein HQM10_16570 [Candidatus Riflebacteria bacterium]|nr:hypothetical protein [Candidatus Riflebacteria bacterium]